jgi:NDP-sugar pyrophosphorylase family protein
LLSPEDFFDLKDFEHARIFEGLEYVWQVLPRIKEYLEENLKPSILGRVVPGAYVEKERVFIGEGTVVEAGACILGPAIIGPGCQIRSGSYIRANCLIGKKAVVGHATEVKNSILLNGAKAPHFNYVGDSVLGVEVNLGAGTKLSNVKVTGETVTVRIGDTIYETGLKKFGAIIGDGVETGCNSTLNPGTIVGKGALIYANASVRGYIPPHTIVKLRQDLETVLISPVEE